MLDFNHIDYTYSGLDPGLSRPGDKNISVQNCRQEAIFVSWVSEGLLSDIYSLVDWASVFMVCPEIAGHPIELYFVNNMKTIYTWCVSIEIKKIYNDILLE